MKTDAEIHIIGRRIYEDGQTDKTEQSVRGRFYLREGRFYLLYRQPDQQGEEAPVTVKAEPGQVSVTESGPLRTQLLFRPGETTQVLLHTDFGAWKMEIRSCQLEMGLTEQGGQLEIRYELFTEGRRASFNRLTIQVRPLPEAESSHSIESLESL